MKTNDCPQCNSTQLELGYPHPRYLVEGLLEVEAHPLRSGHNTSLEACVCPSCGRVQLFALSDRDELPGLPRDWSGRGKAV
jgi:hypothetical protein